MRLVGILGGTFNPIHYGHLRMAQELADALAMDEVKFVPSANPPHKDSVTVSAEHRSAMVELAVADNPLFTLDRCELERSDSNPKAASYTIDTLISLRESLDKKTSLCLMMGSDAFIKLNTWYRWQELLAYAHIVLVERPASQLQAKPQEKLPNELEELLRDHYTDRHTDLKNEKSGYILMQKITAQDIGATRIRELLKLKKSVRYSLPDDVNEYLTKRKLYQA